MECIYHTDINAHSTQLFLCDVVPSFPKKLKENSSRHILSDDVHWIVGDTWIGFDTYSNQPVHVYTILYILGMIFESRHVPRLSMGGGRVLTHRRPRNKANTQSVSRAGIPHS